MKCAIEIQKATAQHTAASDFANRMQFRIGLNLGDLIFDDGNVYGDGINIAARLESIAEHGGVCLSDKITVPWRPLQGLPAWVRMSGQESDHGIFRKRH